MPNDAPIVIRADTSGYDAAMRDIARSTEQFGRVFAATMRRAVLSGRDLDDTLRSVALRFADLALGRALAPIESAIGGLLSGAFAGHSGATPAVGAAPAPANIVFNVTTPDVAGFAKSQAQVSAMLARAVRHGQRAL
ncbi:MAG: hypothetical protein BroJett030_32330 [Alphaproteobacteria bacterium]|nr:MAG: hypothetical protein BroJett030_32330 [Alphaproteobacteria bacterium]